MANRAWTLEECKDHFMEQENQIKQQMEEGEKYEQCLDKDSFDGSCYDPAKVVTSHGRVWSLREGNFLDVAASENVHGYYRITVSGSASEYNHMKYIAIHKLVANYFCNKKLIEIMKAANEKNEEELFNLSVDQYGNYREIEVHHINSNIEDNRAENLQYIYSDVHDILTALHNQNNISERVKGRSLRKLEEVGLDNPYDRGIKIMLDNAVEQGVKLYGYIEEDEKNPKGYVFRLKAGIPVNTVPDYKVTEEDIIKMLVTVHGKKPDVVGYMHPLVSIFLDRLDDDQSEESAMAALEEVNHIFEDRIKQGGWQDADEEVLALWDCVKEFDLAIPIPMGQYMNDLLLKTGRKTVKTCSDARNS